MRKTPAIQDSRAIDVLLAVGVFVCKYLNLITITLKLHLELLVIFQRFQTQSKRQIVTKQGVFNASRRRMSVSDSIRNQHSSLLSIRPMRWRLHSLHWRHREAHWSKVERHHRGHAGTRLNAITTLHHHLLMDQLLLEKLDLLLLPHHDRLVNHSLLLRGQLWLSWNLRGYHVWHLHRS